MDENKQQEAKEKEEKDKEAVELDEHGKPKKQKRPLTKEEQDLED